LEAELAGNPPDRSRQGDPAKGRSAGTGYEPLDLIVTAHGAPVNNATALSTDEYSINAPRTVSD